MNSTADPQRRFIPQDLRKRRPLNEASGLSDGVEGSDVSGITVPRGEVRGTRRHLRRDNSVLTGSRLFSVEMHSVIPRKSL